MADVRIHANRNFRNRTLANGERRGLKNYYAFTHGESPVWWPEASVTYEGELLGVLEIWPSEQRDALVVTSKEIVVLGEGHHGHLRYGDIVSLGKLEKDPISEVLRVMLRSDEVFDLPVRNGTGVIFDVYRFLLYAAAECRPRERPDSVDARHTCPLCQVVSERFRVIDDALVCPACKHTFKPS